MSATEAQKRASNKYHKKTYIQKNIFFRRDNEEDMKLLEHCNKQFSFKGYIRTLILEDMKKGLNDYEIYETGKNQQIEFLKGFWEDITGNEFEFPMERLTEWFSRGKKYFEIKKEMTDIYEELKANNS